MKFRIIVLLFTLILFSCGKSAKDKSTKKSAENVQTVSVDIGGMTCQMGCAKLIESKLAKKEGVKNAKVTFKDSIGVISFDSNIISQKEIVNTIEEIADGELYKVKKISENSK